MAKKAAPQNFASLAAGMITSQQQPAPEEGAKATLTSFELESNLRTPLERVVFWEGKKGSKKAVINAALRYYFAHHNEASAKASRPTPDEGE